ncbi:MAG: hypothetical protein EBZ47_06995 [Chlamydiae bacterium]|nr:hypothetical protein [Chlamydiota bacterium]
MLDNNAWNMRLWETHRFYSTANFYGVSLLVREYSKVQVLSGYKAFNRIVLDEFSNFKALKGVTLTSSCNMWGGIFVEDQCDITLEGTPGDRIELSNANTGVFVYEEYLDVEDPEEIFPESSDAFPFCWHNNQSPNFEDGPTGCSRSQVKFNYVNLWGVKPNVRKTNVGKVA